jgi:hypothetical protein
LECGISNKGGEFCALNSNEEDCHNFGSLRGITCSIADFCGLKLFSTEFAITSDGGFVIVDFVNDPINLRLRSKAVDGMLDDILEGIPQRLVELS